MAYDGPIKPVADGGTGINSTTAYAVLCGGTTSTGPLQSIASVGSSGQVLTSNGAGALPTFQAPGGSLDPFTTLQVFDDFLSSGITGQIYALNWAQGLLDPFAKAPIYGTSTSAHPGVVSLGVDVAPIQCTMLLGDENGNAGPIFLGGGTITCEWVIHIPTLSTGAEQFIVHVGMGNFSGIDPLNDGCYFRYSEASNSGNWQIVNSKNGGTTTVANTNVAASTSWTRLKIVANAAGTSIAYYINGSQVNVSPLTTNITANAISPGMEILKTNGNTLRSLDVDLFSMNIAFTTPR